MLFHFCVLLTLVALSRQVLAHELHDRQISHLDEQYLLRGVDIFHESALAIGTDKAISHDYRKMYGTILLPMVEKCALQNRRLKFLEIGLGCDMWYGPGASVELWRTLFENRDVEIWEAELNATCVAQAQSKGQLLGIHVITGDQASPKILKSWIQQTKGKFDVIIDDGGHRNDMVLNTLTALWPELNPGGWYFIEDLHISYRPSYLRKGYPPVTLVLQSWVEALNVQPAPVSHHHKSLAAKYPLPIKCDMILCQREACALHKEGSNGMEGGSKIRFDLKQIAQWDRQNEQDAKKKATGGKPSGKPAWKKPTVFDEDKDEGGFDHGYRDRALERRKDLNTEETQMEEIVAKLDVEQTKYLGGDIEHTHLVKGLDYALLEKTRLQKAKEDAEARAAELAREAEIPDLETIEPSSAIGNDVLKALRRLRLLEQKALGVSVGSILKRTTFDFDTKPESEVDVPLLVTHSKTEYSAGDEYVNFMPSPDIMAPLAALLETGKFLTAKQKRKKQLREEAERAEKEAQLMHQQQPGRQPGTVAGSSGSSGQGAGSVMVVADDFDIYGEDLVVGKYVPVGSLDDEGPAVGGGGSGGTGSGSSGSGGAAASVTGLFGAPSTMVRPGGGVPAVLPPGISTAMTATATTSTTTSTASAPVVGQDADLMKPIRDLLSAQAAKERAAKERLLTQQQAEMSREMILEKDEKGQLLVHRDVFATSRDKVVNVGEGKDGGKKTKLGEAFGTGGVYDLYPETAHSYNQFFDSDDEEGGPDEPAAKKSRPDSASGAGSGGGAGKGGGGSGGSEWSRPLHSGGGSGGGGGGGGFAHKTGLEGIKKGGMTPWRGPAGGGGSGGSEGGSAGAGGMNRAARRAAGMK